MSDTAYGMVVGALILAIAFILGRLIIGAY